MSLPENEDPVARPVDETVRFSSAIGIIDRLEYRDRGGEVVLVLVESHPWNPASDQAFLLQEKLNAYLSFVLDGEMLENYPSLRNKPVRIVLECVDPPSGRILEFLRLVHDQCELQGIEFMVDVLGKHCACGKAANQCGAENPLPASPKTGSHFPSKDA